MKLVLLHKNFVSELLNYDASHGNNLNANVPVSVLIVCTFLQFNDFFGNSCLNEKWKVLNLGHDFFYRKRQLCFGSETSYR